jgi:hypothetical protein
MRKHKTKKGRKHTKFNLKERNTQHTKKTHKYMHKLIMYKNRNESLQLQKLKVITSMKKMNDCLPF